MIYAKYLRSILIPLLAAAAVAACSTDTTKEALPDNQNEWPAERPPIDEPVVDTLSTDTRIWTAPVEPNADQAMSLSFRAGEDSPLYNYEGELYAYVGVVSQSDTEVWLGSGEWDENLDDRRLYPDPKHKNVWHLRIRPTVRSFFLNAEDDRDAPCVMLGAVIRSADGTLKGIAGEGEEASTFITVKDKNNSGTKIWTTPEEPDADSPMTISFRAGDDSKLYGYAGDIYAHIGVIEYGTWKCVKAGWEENRDECKFEPDPRQKNLWHLRITPTVREYFQSGKISCTEVGVVVRSDDSKLKGFDKDQFLFLTDSKYPAFKTTESVAQPLPAGCTYGINVIDDTTVTFAVHDMDKNGKHHDFAYIIGDFNNWTLSNDERSRMYRDDAKGCWWITVSGLDPTREYRFQYHLGDKGEKRDTVIRMGDAFCELVLDPDDDKWLNQNGESFCDENLDYPDGGSGVVSVVKTTRDGYVWKTADFKVADDLVIYELLLRDFTDTKDLTGAMAKLDYLQALGINAIELMPIQEFDGNDSWGYNPRYYFALDKAYGSRRLYKDFIDECHRRGIAIIVDVVYNHMTGASPLAKIYWNSDTNKTAANNPYFNVDAPHPWSVFHDFNHTNTFVRDMIKRSLVYLIEEYKIDGFRFDLTKGFIQSNNDGAYSQQRIDFLKEYHDAIRAKKEDAVMILEHFCCKEESKVLAEAGMKLWGKNNEAYCQAGMGIQSKSGFDGYTGYIGMYDATMPFNSLVGFMESHDEERVAYKQKTWGHSSVKSSLETRMKRLALNAAFFFTVPGPKMIWQFGELGFDTTLGTEDTKTGRKEPHWEYYDNEHRRAVYDTYAKLIKFRKENPEFFRADADFRWNVNAGSWSGGRTIYCTAGSKAFAVVGNFDVEERSVTATLPVEGGWNDHFTGEGVTTSGTSYTVTLPAGEFKLLTNF